MNTLLATHGLTGGYGDFQALFGVDLEVREGEVVALIGANGAGKSTLLKTVTGLLPARADQVTWRGEPIGGARAERIVGLGLALVPEGRRLFSSLSVEENLLLGAQANRTRARKWHLDSVYALFPILKEKRRQPSTSLSGGQQQMVAIGRALMSNPRLLMCDELSLGLAPIVVREIYDALPALVEDGMSVLIVEQDVQLARRVSQRFYCLQEGRVSLSGASASASDADIANAYFGVAA
ncbi:ABC transporter ATP-binding protein [Pararobbsia silviterrae]|uniref:ABC transporter ATP-binding protein n=1 Tax=Pararobbsia silviterrae TaxID=1792498 RepID=A0A494Y1K7_9BURK|nr:ABC transporter ATP-binding protein [Pararobbsia silviterrae]RKP56652.1 ABC transporter ATP-binding protein [Pararobbsia silviterrae]